MDMRPKAMFLICSPLAWFYAETFRWGHMLQRWLGHAQLSTTAIYADAVGKEEQDIAARMWG